MNASHIGELAALVTAFFWTITALSFEQAAKRIGSLAVNWIRLVLGVTFLTLFSGITRGLFLPLDATPGIWFWLSISGLVGFVFGDLCLFQAFVLIGSRISMLIMALVPLLTTVMSWFVLGEMLTVHDLLGMALTMTGIAIVVLVRPLGEKRFRFSHPIKGILLAFGGAMGQAGGMVISKFGMGDYNAFAATQIRAMAGLAGFTLLYFIIRKWGIVRAALHHPSGLRFTLLGAFFGPFLGVSFSLFAIQHTLAGVASTIIAIVPVLIIPPAVLIFHERVTAKEIIGALVAVSGVALLFL